MLVAALFIPVVAGNVFLKSKFNNIPEITERSTSKKTYMIFDPCSTHKAGNRIVSCSHLTRKGDNESTHYSIKPYNTFYVKCDIHTDGGGWTMIQRRSWAEREGNGFEKSDEDYEKGFDGEASSYWIGNQNIHALTSHPNNKQILRIELTKPTGEMIIVEYKKFQVGSKEENFKLSIGDYSSPNGSYYDALKYHDGAPFLTSNGTYHEDLCARTPISGGWWFPAYGCFHSNLNGRKFKEEVPPNTKGYGITWYKQGDESSYQYIYESVEMKIRDADFKFCTRKMAK